jgi:3'-phosphoadenosine 5'-phosphosulfate sulfotransferase (PAPS reductase)/FAD synthetase
MIQQSLFHCGLEEPEQNKGLYPEARPVIKLKLVQDLPAEAVTELEPILAPSLVDYDRFIVFFSGGKDSVACFLWLLEQGIPVEKIELHHHLVDGREGSTLMDWRVTEDYCVQFAKAFGVRLSFSWKEGGFEREMLRENAPTAPVHFYTQSGEKRQVGGDSNKLNTRRKFPQVSADLSTRWCSSYLKIGVGESYIVNDPVFREGKTLVLTGERAEESSARAKYKPFEPHRSDNRDGARVKRWVDVFRAVHSWAEAKVWDIMRKYGVNPHPAYHLGLSRASCMACIFGNADQWAMLKKYMPDVFREISDYEVEFGVTIKRDGSIEEYAAKGVAPDLDAFWVDIATGETFNAPVLIDPAKWELPLGAFGESAGPT